jgi:hypothetical protein
LVVEKTAKSWRFNLVFSRVQNWFSAPQPAVFKTLIGLICERGLNAFWPLFSVGLIGFSLPMWQGSAIGQIDVLTLGVGIAAAGSFAALLWGIKRFRMPPSTAWIATWHRAPCKR